MKTPFKCPICNGSQIVPAGFYNQTSGHWSNTSAHEPCRSCNGTGIIWGEDSIQPVKTEFDKKVEECNLKELRELESETKPSLPDSWFVNVGGTMDNPKPEHPVVKYLNRAGTFRFYGVKNMSNEYFDSLQKAQDYFGKDAEISLEEFLRLTNL